MRSIVRHLATCVAAAAAVTALGQLNAEPAPASVQEKPVAKSVTCTPSGVCKAVCRD